MIIGITGHRNLGGYNSNPVSDFVKSEIKRIFLEIKPDSVISGFAIGADQIAVEVCIELNIQFTAAIPFKGQELAWPEQARKKYFELLAHTKSVVYVSPGGYVAWKMQARNQYIVDNCDVLIAVFNGTSGGTKNCHDYAVNKNKRIIVIDPLDFDKH